MPFLVAVLQARLMNCSLTVGGGYGYLCSERGLVVDNLLGATVVIADGSILHVSNKENEDVCAVWSTFVAFLKLILDSDSYSGASVVEAATLAS